LKLKCDNFKNEISKIKNEKKLDGNKIKIQMTQEIEDLAAQNASLEHKYAVLQSQINEMKIEIKQSEIIKQSLLNQIKDKNIELSNQKTEFNEIINNYETKISTQANQAWWSTTEDILNGQTSTNA
jgi:ABC-type phosphate transport system auxiliary subunit